MDTTLILRYNEKKIQHLLLKIMDVALCAFALSYFLFTLVVFLIPTTGVEILNKVRFVLGFFAVCSECLYCGYMVFIYSDKKTGERKIFEELFSFETLMLLLLVLLFALSCIFYPLLSDPSHSIGYYFTENVSVWSETFYQVFILLPFGLRLTKLIDRKDICMIIHVLLVIITLGELFVLFRVFINDPIIFTQNSFIGMDEAYRLNIGVNSNTSGMMAYCIMFLSVCMMIISDKTPFKVLCFFEALITYGIVILTGARGSIYGVSIVIGLMVGIWLFKKARSKKIKLLSIFLGILTVLLMIGTMKIFYDFSLSVVKPTEIPVVASTKTYSDGVLYLAEADNTGASDRLTSTTSSGRTEIWQASMKALVHDKSSFIFGVTPVNVPSRLNTYIEGYGGYAHHSHNQFLEIGLGFGVPAMCVFMLFVFLLIKKSIQILMRRDLSFRWLLPSFGLALILFNNMFEAYLIGTKLSYVMCSGFFPVLCGMLISRCRMLKIGVTENRIIENASEKTVRIFSATLVVILCVVLLGMVLIHL